MSAKIWRALLFFDAERVFFLRFTLGVRSAGIVIDEDGAQIHSRGRAARNSSTEATQGPRALEKANNPFRLP
ncbi:MAG: hypothetical protein Q4C87_02835 [Actinomycetaceae bacterium]|nr:hypothetical protein [Actinomycetaceae bacterium]